ncbi:hypothetical protein CIHG_06342 [Coccidioides immitis H538.4]|uniref:Secreted protein n=1 Tax=Coccidioides immitis H538.4 TaxID=396776 RepID=A0A0J8RUV1_COCIT|nr:hypothetical protein CIHG_06342 [Coccidioides immitis H538.4]
MLYIFAFLLDLIGHHDSARPSSDGENFDFPLLAAEHGLLIYLVRSFRAINVWIIPGEDGCDIRSHIGEGQRNKDGLRFRSTVICVMVTWQSLCQLEMPDKSKKEKE